MPTLHSNLSRRPTGLPARFRGRSRSARASAFTVSAWCNPLSMSNDVSSRGEQQGSACCIARGGGGVLDRCNFGKTQIPRPSIDVLVSLQDEIKAYAPRNRLGRISVTRRGRTRRPRSLSRCRRARAAPAGPAGAPATGTARRHLPAAGQGCARWQSAGPPR